MIMHPQVIVHCKARYEHPILLHPLVKQYFIENMPPFFENTKPPFDDIAQLGVNIVKFVTTL
jgi:hypothetical protein